MLCLFVQRSHTYEVYFLTKATQFLKTAAHGNMTQKIHNRFVCWRLFLAAH